MSPGLRRAPGVTAPASLRDLLIEMRFRCKNADLNRGDTESRRLLGLICSVRSRVFHTLRDRSWGHTPGSARPHLVLSARRALRTLLIPTARFCIPSTYPLTGCSVPQWSFIHEGHEVFTKAICFLPANHANRREKEFVFPSVSSWSKSGLPTKDTKFARRRFVFCPRITRTDAKRNSCFLVSLRGRNRVCPRRTRSFHEGDLFFARESCEKTRKRFRVCGDSIANQVQIIQVN